MLSKIRIPRSSQFRVHIHACYCVDCSTGSSIFTSTLVIVWTVQLAVPFSHPRLLLCGLFNWQFHFHIHAYCCAVGLFVGCVTSQQQASVSQGRICSDKFTYCHTEIEVADQTFYLTQSQYSDTGPTSPSADPIMPGAWQGSHWSANF